MRLYTQDATTIQERNGDHFISGYAARWYDPADPGTEYHLFLDAFERFAPSAFDTSQQKPVECRWNHSADFVLGSTQNQTLALRTDDRGLWYDQRYNAHDPDHAKVRAKIDSDLCHGSSVGFFVVAADWKREGTKDVYTITKTELRDVGPVGIPAYKSATATFRSNDNDLKNLKDQYETWKRLERMAKFLT